MQTLFENLKQAGRNNGAHIGGGDFTAAQCKQAADCVADMLAALESLVSGNFGQPSGVTVPALDEARAIIAKAKGN